MKILHLISGGDSGGAKTHVFALLDVLSRMPDTSVQVACLIPGVFYEECTHNPVLFQQKSRMDLSVCKNLIAFVQREQVDIINAHGARANFIAMLIKKRLTIPIVTTVHSDPKLDFDKPTRKLLYGGLNQYSLKRLDYFIAVTDAFRALLISYGLGKKKLYTVYNGKAFRQQLPPMDRPAFAARWGIPYDPQASYIGIAARFAQVKGVDVFLRAAAEVARQNPTAHFVVAGDGAEGAALHTLLNSLGLQERVSMIGYCDDMDGFYSFIHINALSSHSESFPYALLEGAEFNLPTVATAVGGIPKLIQDGKTGLLFPDNDHSAMAEKLLLLLREPETAARLGRSLGALARETFSDEALGRQYRDIYIQVIADYRYKRTS